MRKYILYMALSVSICTFSCGMNGNSVNSLEKQKLKEKLEKTATQDSTKKQIKTADAELKSFLKDN